MPKTAEQRKREFDDAKDKRPKVLTHNGVVVPEIKYVRQSAYETRLSGSQAHHGGKGGVYIASLQCDS